MKRNWDVTPFFSFIVPCYNSERYLTDCIESLLGQTFNNYEIIIVDDGSTDCSRQLIERFFADRDNVTYIYQKNKGPYAARRVGASHARGEYLVFFDSDDMASANLLDRCFNMIMSTNADIIQFDMTRKIEELDGTPTNSLALPDGLYCGDNYLKVKEATCSGKMNWLCGKAIRRNLTEWKGEGASSEKMLLAEDWLQLLDLIDAAKVFVAMSAPLYYYRDNEDGTTLTFRRESIRDLCRLSNSLQSYADEWGGNCSLLAQRSLVSHVTYLMRNLERCKLDHKAKKEIYSELRDNYITRIQGSCLRGWGRLDMRMMYIAISRRCYVVSSIICRISNLVLDR